MHVCGCLSMSVSGLVLHSTSLRTSQAPPGAKSTGLSLRWSSWSFHGVVGFSMPSSDVGGRDCGSPHTLLDSYSGKPYEHKHTPAWQDMFTQMYKQVLTDTCHLGLLLPLKISFIISTLFSNNITVIYVGSCSGFSAPPCLFSTTGIFSLSLPLC